MSAGLANSVPVSVRGVGFAAGLAACAVVLSSCNAAVAGEGSPTTHGTRPATSATVRPATSAAPPPTASSMAGQLPPVMTAIGNPRTADMCSVIDAAAFARYGQVSAPTRRTPIDCNLHVTTTPGGAGVELSVYVSGESPDDTALPTRRASGLLEYQDGWQPLDHLCAASIEARGVAVGVQARDDTAGLPERTVCAMREALADQVAAAIAGHDVAHVTYGPRSLTKVAMCSLTDGSVAQKAPFAAYLHAADRAFQNECDLANDVYFVDIYAGVTPAPLRPMPGGRTLTVQGHRLVQLDPATPRHCQLTSEQAPIPDSDNSETIEVWVAVRPKHPAGALTGAALCEQIGAPMLVSVLETAGRR